jgi:hypothetical protein
MYYIVTFSWAYGTTTQEFSSESNAIHHFNSNVEQYGLIVVEPEYFAKSEDGIISIQLESCEY